MPKKILLADDSLTIQKVVELTFSEADYDVVVVGDGAQAIERIEADPPDIVLADVMMPKKTGYEVCEFVKSQPRLAHIPVLLLVGKFEPFDQPRAKSVGAQGHILKPFESNVLVKSVTEMLAAVSRAAPPAPAAAASPAAAVASRSVLMPEPSPFEGAPPTPVAAAPGGRPGGFEATPARGFAPPDDARSRFSTEVPPLGTEPGETESAPAAPREAWTAPAGGRRSGYTSVTAQVERPVLPDAIPAAQEDFGSAPAAPFDDAETPFGSTPEPFGGASYDDAAPFGEEPIPAGPAPTAPPAPVAAMGAMSPMGDIPRSRAGADTTPGARPVSLAPTTPASLAGGGALTAAGVPEAVIDAIVERVLRKMSDEAIRDIAWQVVPELAELLIKKKLEELG